MNRNQKLLPLLILLHNTSSFKTLIPIKRTSRLYEGYSGDHATDTYYKTPFNPPNNCHGYELNASSNKNKYRISNGDAVTAGRQTEELQDGPGRRFDVLKQMDALHQVGNENEVRSLWRSSRKTFKGIDDNFFEGCTIPETNKFYNDRVITDAPPNPNSKSTRESRNVNEKKRVDDTRKTKDIPNKAQERKVNSFVVKERSFDDDFSKREQRPFDGRMNDGYSNQMQGGRLDDTRRNQMFQDNRVDYTRSGNDGMNKDPNRSRRDDRRQSPDTNGRINQNTRKPRGELSQRILQAMDPYNDNPYYQQQQGEELPFDTRSNRHDPNIQEYERRATDLETRLESFKDYDRERIDFEDYGFTNEPQNPFKRNIYEDGPSEDRNQDDTMRDLEEDILKSPNPYKQYRGFNQEVQDTIAPLPTVPETIPVEDNNKDLSEEISNDAEMEGDKVNLLEERLGRMESRLNQLFDKLESKFD